MTLPNKETVRGEIWEVRFDPSEGDEIKKIRPAVVMNVARAGRMRLHIVVPITGWQPQFSKYFWMIHIAATPENGLIKESSADAFQVKSISVNRFQNKIGYVSQNEMYEITLAIALCIGLRP